LEGVTVFAERELCSESEHLSDARERPTLRVRLASGITDAQIAGLAAHDWAVTDGDTQTVYKGYAQLLRHEIVFAGEDENELADQLDALSDAIRTFAKQDKLTAQDVWAHSTVFDAWGDRVGTQAAPGEYLRHGDGLYRVKAPGHLISEQWPPGVATASLFDRIQPPGAGPEAWQTGQSYAKGVEVAHKGGVWLSGVDNNTWEPGGPGVYDNIWKRVRDV